MSNYEVEILSHITTPSGIRRIWSSGIRQEHFNDSKNRQAFQFAIDAWIKDGMGDHVVSDELLSSKFGVSFEESTTPLTTLVEEVKGRYRKDIVSKIVQDASQMLLNNDVDGVLPFVIDKSSEVNQSLRARTQELTTDDFQFRRDFYARMEEDSRDNTTGAPFGFPEIDERIGGTRPGELTVVAGYSGIGKSNFLGWSAIRAQDQGFKVLYVTLEMPIADVLMRMDAYSSGLAMGKLLNPRPGACLTAVPLPGMPQGEIGAWHSAQERMMSGGICANGKERFPIRVVQPSVGERSVAQIVALAREHQCDYLLIDQLSHVEDRRGSNFRDRRERHGDRIMELKDLILDPGSGQQMACMLAVQMNRDSQKSKGRRGEQWNVAESADVERTADILIGLSRSETDYGNQLMTMDELKLRRGEPKSWSLNWSFSPHTEFSVYEELNKYEDD